MQGVVRTDLHALAAANTARQEVLFIERSGRAKKPFITLCGKAGSTSRQRPHSDTSSQTGQNFPSLQVRPDTLLFREKLKSQPVLRTFIHAVKAQMALRLSPRHAADRIVAALAAEKAPIAVAAMLRILD